MSSVDSPVFPAYLGVDVGGTSIKIGIVDDSGQSLAHGKIATEHEKGPENGVARILSFAKALLEEAGVIWQDIRAVGLGTPGTMNVKEGELLHMPNMSGWNFFPIRRFRYTEIIAMAASAVISPSRVALMHGFVPVVNQAIWKLMLVLRVWSSVLKSGW
jgi:hypothetical protein